MGETIKVSVRELKPKMVIRAFIGFGRKYRPVNKRTSEWVKLNFRGTKAIIKRNGKKYAIPIQKLSDGDDILKIYEFPKEMRKLTTVTPKLAAVLGKNEFVQFEVQFSKPDGKKPSLTRLNHKKQVKEAEIFIEKVGKSVEAREEATHAIEDLMDSTRSGKINVKLLDGMVSQFAENAASEAISAVASLKKSDQTYAHCVDVGAIFQTVYLKLVEKKLVSNKFENDAEMLMGAFLHDFGKSKIPKEILDNTERYELESREMDLMRQHPEFSANILNKMMMSNDVIDMAHYHHVKLDTSLISSYPKVESYEKLSTETKLLAIVDIYQALVGRRTYKKSWAPPSAMLFIDGLAGVEHDPDIWDAFYQVLGQYPIGSLVELNDGSLAFVMSVSESDLSRPRVVVVRNAAGEDLTHHSLMDLQEQKEVSIKKGVDHMEIYGSDSIDVFSNLKVS